MGFKVVMKYSDGSVEEEDDVFDTAEKAEEHGQNQVDNYHAGGEVLYLSNPGDYPLDDDDDVDFEVIEVHD